MPLRKELIERNCPPLPEDVAERLKGGHDGIEGVKLIGDAIRREKNIKHLMKKLKEILEDEYKDEAERRAFMDRALKREWWADDEAEAVRRVYVELYGPIVGEGIRNEV